ncbi:putative deacetoxyvindoline 4-hydroxylase [Helianthus annuus]|nr:putative deacetoxyvindoline 4-hydroxylase [Helianthus annuus]
MNTNKKASMVEHSCSIVCSVSLLNSLQVRMSPIAPDWEAVPEMCREPLAEWDKAAVGLGEELMSILCDGLGIKSDKLKELSCLEGRVFASHYYPQCPQPELTVGLTSHTDPGVLTMVVQNEVGGLLQVKCGDDWADVEAVHGAIVVNIGDLLQVSTSRQWRILPVECARTERHGHKKKPGQARAKHSICKNFGSKYGKLALRPKNLPGPWPCQWPSKNRPCKPVQPVFMKIIMCQTVNNIREMTNQTSRMMSNDEYKSAQHRVLANHVEGARVSIAVFFNPSNRDKLYGPFPELISTTKPAVYREFKYEDYMRRFFTKELDGKTLTNFYKVDNTKA